MKNLLLTLSMLGLLVACGSAEKKAEETQEKAQTEMESTAEEIEAAIEEEARGVEVVTSRVTNETQSSNDSLKFTCSLNSDQRVIEVKKHSEVSCDVYYTKFGNETKIGGAQFGANYCVKLAEKVKSNLESAGFSCSL